MKNSKDYFESTKNNPPRPLLVKFLEMKSKAGKAIDLGCGAGADTVCLIKNGWNVTAIDIEDTEDLIKERLSKDDLKRFNFSRQSFEEIELDFNNLLVANFSIPFCNKHYFKEFWNKIVNSIQKDGYFVGNFLGLNDSWVKTKLDKTFLAKEQVLNLFVGKFEIILLEETEVDKATALGKLKHWHIYNVIAKKK